METSNETTPTPEYLKGFNHGYTIAQHNPSLSLELAKSLSDTEQSKGFQSGIRQYQLDKIKSFEPSWMKDNVQPNEPDKSKDDKEHERE